MQRLLIAAALAGVFAIAAHAQTTTSTCKATAAEKKLAGAAKASNVKKCTNDAVGT